MKNLNPDKLKSLAQERGENLLSIYFPTHKGGKQVYNEKDKTSLNSAIHSAKNILVNECGMGKKEAEIYLQPAADLLDDKELWENMDEGFALFLFGKNLRYFRLPYPVQPFQYVSDHFYLKPMLSAVQDKKHFLLLALSQKQVKLFEGDSLNIHEVDTGDAIPQTLEAVVGSDFEESFLQFRSGQAGTGTASFHGHGAGKDDMKIEVEKFLRGVDDSLKEFLNDHKSPLVLACVDYLYPIFKNVSRYQQIYPQFIRKNPDNENPQKLHGEALEILKPHFDQERKELAGRYRELAGTGKVSANLSEIVPQAAGGRVEAIFIENESDLWGTFDKNKASAEVRETPEKDDISLTNFVAVQTLLNSGKVFFADADEMPDPQSSVNAVYRY